MHILYGPIKILFVYYFRNFAYYRGFSDREGNNICKYYHVDGIGPKGYEVEE